MEPIITDCQKIQTILDELGMSSYRMTQELELSSGALYTTSLENQTKTIIDINSKLEKLSWVDNVDDECLELIKGLLDKSNAVHKKLIRTYVSMSWVITKDIATKAMRNYKIALDDLKEHNQDLEDLYFNLPADTEFAKRIEMLSN